MATSPPFPTRPPSCPPGEPWDLDGRRGLRTESRGRRPTPDSLPASHGQMGPPGPSPSRPRISRLCASPPTDTVNGRQQAASRLAIYSVVTSGLGRPPGAGREPPVLSPPLHTALSHCRLARTCTLALSPSLCPLPLYLSGFPCLPPCLCLSWPRPCHPRRDPWVPLGLRQAMSQLAGVLALGRWAGRCDCSQTRAGLSLFLFLISGGPFWSLSYFIVLGGVFGGGGGGEELVLMGFVGTFRNFYQSHV